MVQEKEFELDYVIKTTAELINDSEPVLNALMRFFENTQESYKEQRVLVENGELDPWDIAPVENEVDYELVEFVAQALNPVISHITKVIAERYKTNPADLYDGYFLQEYNREVYRMKYALHDKDGTRLEKNVFETIIRVAIAVAAVEGRYNNNSAVSAFASFFAVMALKYFIGGGRIMANAGSYLYKNSTTLINCTVMNQIPDSIDGIMDVAKQAALSLKSGAGVGYNFSTIRPKGAFVHGAGAETSGVISFMEIYDKTCNTIMSAGGRRGAQMATLHVEHPEIRSFITAKREDGILRNFNLSVLPTDKFMHAVENNENIDLWFWEKTDLEQIPEGAQGAYIKAGDIPYSHPDAEYFIFREGHAEVEYGNATPHTIFKKKIYETVPASEIYDLIMESTYDFAEPGFILIDRINEMNNLAPYGEHIQATNPCVTGDTIVPTLEGLKRIDELAGRNDLMTITDRRPNYDLFGTEISSAEAVYSGEKDVLEVVTEKGYSLRLTPDHLIYTPEYGYKEAGSLNVGDKISIQSGDNKMRKQGDQADAEQGFVLGALVHNGSFTTYTTEDGEEVPAYKARFSQAEQVSYTILHDTIMQATNGEDMKYHTETDQEVGLQTIWYYDEAAVKWLQEIGAGDLKSVPENIINGSSKRAQAFLRGLFGTLGPIFDIDELPGKYKRKKGAVFVDRDIAKTTHLLLLDLGIPSHYIDLDTVFIVHSAKEQTLKYYMYNDSIVSIKPAGKEKVYDLKVPQEATFIANGIVVHNCGEQPLPPNGSCNLGSVFLHSFVDNPFNPRATYRYYEYLEAVGIANRFLDNVNDITNLPLPSLRQQAWYKRRHGLGVTGVADMLAAMGYRYGAPKAISALDRIFGGLAAASLASNFYLAEQKGSAPIFLSKGPEKIKESKYIQAVVENIKKIPQLEFMHRKIVTSLAANAFLRYSHATSIAPTGTMSLTWGDNVANGIEPTFSHSYMRNTRVSGKLAKTQNRIFSAAYKWYLNIVGDNENMTNPDELIPTTDNVTLQAHIDTQAVAQKWIDSSVSKTCNIPTEFPFEDFKNAYIDAWKRGVKGFTTFRFNPNFSVGVLTRDNDLKNTKYVFTYTDANGVERELKVNGDDTIMYKGEKINASNLYEALKEKLLGKM